MAAPQPKSLSITAEHGVKRFMNKWRPITEQELRSEISRGLEELSTAQLRFWNAIAIDLCKWEQSPWGDEGGGFWAVAVIGRRVIYFNDIEDGFNISSFARYGSIDEYLCDQGGLQAVIYDLFSCIIGDEEGNGSFGPPRKTHRE